MHVYVANLWREFTVERHVNLNNNKLSCALVQSGCKRVIVEIVVETQLSSFTRESCPRGMRVPAIYLSISSLLMKKIKDDVSIIPAFRIPTRKLIIIYKANVSYMDIILVFTRSSEMNKCDDQNVFFVNFSH